MTRTLLCACAMLMLASGCSENVDPLTELEMPGKGDSLDACGGCVDDAGECVDAPSQEACGTGGIACTSCTSDQVCSQDFECDAAAAPASVCDATACGANATCASSGECEFNPGVMFQLDFVSGTVPAVNLSGGGWDTGDNKPDTYVRLRFPGSDEWKRRTMPAKDTVSPVWAANVTWGEGPSLVGTYGIELFDSDGNDDDSMGACEFEITLEDVLAAPKVFDFECAKDEALGRAGWSVKYLLQPF